MAIRGGTVCRMHGGAAPRVREAARQRLEAMVTPALAELAKLIRSADSDATKLAAIKDVLNRCGFELPQRLETDQLVTIKVEYEPLPEVMPVDLAVTSNGHANGKAHVV